MNSRSNKKTYSLALSGICLAFAVICVSAASIVPGAELTLYSISGIFTGVIILETGVKGGALFYVGAVLLSLVLSPNKINVIPYIFFFGIYGFIKYYAEKLKSLVAQMAVKVLSFASVFFVAFTCFKDLFFGNITLPDVSLWLLAIGGIALFVLYDYIYTLAILIYKKRIKREYVEEIKLSGDENGDEKRQSK